MMSDTTINVFLTATPDFINRESIEHLIRITPDFIRENINRIKHPTKRNEYITGILLLSRALSGYFQGETILKKLRISEFGKPYIEHLADFNISHSNGYTVCCVSPHCRVGIDIEKWVPINLVDYVDYLPQPVFTDIQRSANTLACFYDYWTKLESAVKADGRGFSIAPESVTIFSDHVLVFNKRWYIRQLNLLRDYSCCIAYDRLESSFKINKIDA